VAVVLGLHTEAVVAAAADLAECSGKDEVGGHVPKTAAAARCASGRGIHFAAMHGGGVWQQGRA